MLKEILAITGKPGLFKLVANNGRMLLVEDVKTGKRFPVSSRDKVVAIGDVAMYTVSDDKPLTEIFASCYKVNDGKTVNIKGLVKEGKLQEAFAAVLPDYDDSRVYQNDMRKMFSWYNTLVEAGYTSFDKAEDAPAETEETVEETEEKTEEK